MGDSPKEDDYIIDRSDVLSDQDSITEINDAKGKKDNSIWSFVWEVIETAVITLILFMAIRQVAVNYRIEGSSMYPTLHNRQLIFVERVSYHLHPPERGDIIVFDYPLNPKVRFVKRVIGLPGETISVHDGKVYIDGKPLDEPYVREPIRGTLSPTKVSPRQVFVMGDNRNHSNDSRSWGPLDDSYIMGRAFLSYWPPARIGIIQHWNYKR